MHRALHYRELPDHARQLAQATWQDDLEEMLGCLARDFEIADDIEAGATEVRHPELSPSEPTVQPRRSRLRSAHVTTTASGNRRTADRRLWLRLRGSACASSTGWRDRSTRLTADKFYWQSRLSAFFRGRD
jgi:hypothetical protein